MITKENQIEKIIKTINEKTKQYFVINVDNCSLYGTKIEFDYTFYYFSIYMGDVICSFINTYSFKVTCNPYDEDEFILDLEKILI